MNNDTNDAPDAGQQNDARTDEDTAMAIEISLRVLKRHLDQRRDEHGAVDAHSPAAHLMHGLEHLEDARQAFAKAAKDGAT